MASLKSVVLLLLVLFLAQFAQSQSPVFQKRVDEAYRFLVANVKPSPSNIVATFGAPHSVDTQAVWTEPGLGTNKYITFHFDSLEIQLFYQDGSHLYFVQRVTYTKSALLPNYALPIGSKEKNVTSLFGQPIVNEDFFPNEFHYHVTGSPNNTLIFVFENHRLTSIVCQPYYD